MRKVARHMGCQGIFVVFFLLQLQKKKDAISLDACLEEQITDIRLNLKILIFHTMDNYGP